MNNRGGYLKVYRNLFNPSHDLHPRARGEPACSGWAWIELCMMAEHRNGKSRSQGELSASLNYLATRWCWDRKKVLRFLRELEEEGRIRREHRKGPREPDRITILKYSTYQGPQDAGTTNGTTNDTTNGTTKVPGSTTTYRKPGTTSGTTNGTTNGTEYIGEEQEQEQYIVSPEKLPKGQTGYPPEFEELWEAYPQRPANPKKKALHAWQARTKEGVSHTELLEGVQNYAAYRHGKDPKYTKLTATFLGPDEHWKTDYSTPAKTPRSKKPRPPLTHHCVLCNINFNHPDRLAFCPECGRQEPPIPDVTKR